MLKHAYLFTPTTPRRTNFRSTALNTSSLLSSVNGPRFACASARCPCLYLPLTQPAPCHASCLNAGAHACQCLPRLQTVSRHAIECLVNTESQPVVCCDRLLWSSLPSHASLVSELYGVGYALHLTGSSRLCRPLLPHHHRMTLGTESFRNAPSLVNSKCLFIHVQIIVGPRGIWEFFRRWTVTFQEVFGTSGCLSG